MKKYLKPFSFIASSFAMIVVVSLFLFFKTDLFKTNRDLWVQTVMSTSTHQWLATAFLSNEEIQEILADYEVENKENSTGDEVTIAAQSTASDNVEKTEISGETYQGYVLTIKDPSTVQLINTLDGDEGSKLSQVVTENNYVAAINAAGFNFTRNNSSGALGTFTMMDGELLYGEKEENYAIIGLTNEGKLLLGNYTYETALDAGITSAISFGPFLLVNGNEQITEEETGGLQPRSAIGQGTDGTFYFVVIEGRQADSLGATLYDLQEIMENLGAVNAVNLDGGGSSELYYEGERVNTLSNGNERSIPNAFVVTEKSLS